MLAGMDYEELQGWFADPFRLHEQRYFSAGRPTKLVRDGSVDSYDEPPSANLDPAEAVALQRFEAPDLPGGAGTTGAVGSQRSGHGPRSRRARAIVLAVTAITAAAAVVAVVIWQRSGATSRQPGIAAMAYVIRSAHRTLAERTAHVTLTGSVEALGHTSNLTGSGEVNLTTGAMAMTEFVGAPSAHEVARLIVTRDSIYLALTVNGRGLGSATGGRDWIQIPVASSSSANLTSNDPLSSLLLLEQRGDAIRVVGTKIISGIACTGYSVRFGRQAMVAAARQEAATLGIRPLTGDLVRAMPATTITIWLDAKGLVRQANTTMQINGPGGASISGLVVETFSHYGTPVQITTPAPSDTISLKALLQRTGLSGLS
jgi:hypothetical protein